jgi:hypothetical protein
LENFNQYKPFITIFELSQEEIDMLPEINECSKGLLFTKLWEERGITRSVLFSQCGSEERYPDVLIF